MKEYMELIHDFFADELTEEQHQRLEAWLEESPDHVGQFVREAFISRQISDVMASRKALGMPSSGLSLLGEGENNGAFGDSPLGTPPDSSAFFNWPGMLPKLSVLFGILLLLGAFLIFCHDNVDDSLSPPVDQLAQSVPGKPSACEGLQGEDRGSIAGEIARDSAVASVEPLEHSLWRDGQEERRVINGRVEAGRTLDLLRGKVRVSFDCGAVLTLTGLTALKVDSSMNATLLRGDVSAVVSQEAIGFLLHTAEMDVRDLGTEFKVSVIPDGSTKVEVLDGEVEADLVKQPGHDKETVSLVQGQYLRTGNGSSDTPDQLTVFRGTRIRFDQPDCLERFTIQNLDPDHYWLDLYAGKLFVNATWGSVYARRGRGSNLFLLPLSSSVDFDVVLTVTQFEPETLSDHIGLVYLADEDNFARIIYAAGFPKQGPRYIKFNLEKAGTPLKEFEYPTDFGSQPFKLRLTRRGNEVSGWWSTDGGASWILRSKDQAPQDARYVGFYVSGGHGVPKDKTHRCEACIESFEIECGE